VIAVRAKRTAEPRLEVTFTVVDGQARNRSIKAPTSPAEPAIGLRITQVFGMDD
jgi:hypothetical protein